jgi:pilus assembly protein CpaC
MKHLTEQLQGIRTVLHSAVLSVMCFAALCPNVAEAAVAGGPDLNAHVVASIPESAVPPRLLKPAARVQQPQTEAAKVEIRSIRKVADVVDQTSASPDGAEAAPSFASHNSSSGYFSQDESEKAAPAPTGASKKKEPVIVASLSAVRGRHSSRSTSHSPEVSDSVNQEGSADSAESQSPDVAAVDGGSVSEETAPAPAAVEEPVVAPAPAPVEAPAVVAEVAPAAPVPAASPAPELSVVDNPRATRQPKAKGGANILRVLTGKSIILDLKADAKRVSVADPEVAEVLIISPRQVMVNGLAEGETSVIVWDRSGNYTMYSLVSGSALQDQVMLEVTVAEINRTAMEKHGMDFRSFGGQFGVVSNYGDGAALTGQNPPAPGDPLFPFGLDGGLSWAIVDTKNNIAAMFQQIQDENLGRVLAEPKLLTRSGKEANFLSGGEIPIVVTQEDDTSIEFKEFGTKIKFIPRVREDGKIDLDVASEVSEPDFASGVELFGFTVPAFVTRRVDTEVSLDDGQSLIIAGLIKETKQELESKMPFIGDVPFLGYFFRATEFQNDVVELIIVIRPHLIEAIEEGTRVQLPTDRGPLTRGEVRTKPAAEKVSRPRPW